MAARCPQAFDAAVDRALMLGCFCGVSLACLVVALSGVAAKNVH